MRRLSLLAALIGAISTLALGAIAGAEEGPARAEYVSQLEKVCKPGAEATERTMTGVRAEVRAHHYKVAAAKFDKAARIFKRTLGAIKPVPRPTADKSSLAKWFRLLNRQGGYLDEIAAKLRARNAPRTQRLTARFIHTGNLANNVVLAFGFDYCSFKFSRYS